MADNFYYILKDGEPIVVDDIVELGKWFENFDNRLVARTQIQDAMISTVFLGLDHAWGGGSPVLFETMIFGGKHDDYQDRYTSLEEAMFGHEYAVGLVQKDITIISMFIWPLKKFFTETMNGAKLLCKHFLTNFFQE